MWKKIVSLMVFCTLAGSVAAAGLTPAQTNLDQKAAIKEAQAVKGAILTPAAHDHAPIIDPCALTQKTKFCSASNGTMTVVQVGSVIGGGIIQVTTTTETRESK